MKLSDKPTDFILLQAQSSSQFDNNEFAIVHLSEKWKQTQMQRIEDFRTICETPNFQSIIYYDTSICFYRTQKKQPPDIETIMTGKIWGYIEFDEKKQNLFTSPEVDLQHYSLVLLPNGTAYYKAQVKHTDEEFWTEEFSLDELIK